MEFLASFVPYYYFIYWLGVMLLTISQFLRLNRCPGYAVINLKYDYRPLLLFSIFFILFYGLRPLGVGGFGDTGNYYKSYTFMHDFGVLNMSGDTEAHKDPLFVYFMFYCAQIIDAHIFFSICIFFYVTMMFLGCRKIDVQHGALLMLFCYGAFEFYAFAVNGVRNGMATSFVIMAVACLCKNNKIWALVWSFIAIGIHKSTALPVVTLFFSYYVTKPKYMFITWLGAIVLSLAIGGYIDNLLSFFSYDERLSQNLQGNDADGLVLAHRFRWDFLLFSSMPILLGWYTIFKRKVFNKTYLVLLGTYIYANSFWILAIRAIFSNRIAYLSWFIYPIVLAYPLINFPVFKKNHSKKTAWILLGHWGFTTILWLLV